MPGIEVRGAEDLAEGEAGERGGGAEDAVPEVLGELDPLDLVHDRDLGSAVGEHVGELSEDLRLLWGVFCRRTGGGRTVNAEGDAVLLSYGLS